MPGLICFRLNTSSLVKLIGIFSIFWPLASVAIPFTGSVSFFSSLPIGLALILIVFSFFQGRRHDSMSLFLILFIFLTCLFPIFRNSESDFFRSIKTFASPAVFLFVVNRSFLLKDKILDFKSIVKDLDLFFNLALLASFFGFLELLIRHFLPSLADLWYSKLALSGFAGTEYLQYGYMDYGLIFHGQRPLGLFGDQHTAPLVAILCSVYFMLVRNQARFWLGILACVLTFRFTYFPFCLLLIYLNGSLSSKLSINCAFVSFCVLSSTFVFDYVNSDSSGAILVEHFFAGINLTTSSLIDLIFGLGYTGDLNTYLSYNEVFIYKYFTFFGFIGVLYWLLLISIPFSLFLYFQRQSLISHQLHFLPKRYSNKAFLALSLVPIFGQLHYNSFYTPTASFLYSAILAFGVLLMRNDIILTEP